MIRTCTRFLSALLLTGLVAAPAAAPVARASESVAEPRALPEAREAPEAPGAPSAGYERRPFAADVVLQEHARALGVDGWTVTAAVSIAAAAAPELERLRADALAARDAWEAGTGTRAALDEARHRLRARAGEVLGEIQGLLTPAQADALAKLVEEARRA